MNSTYFISPEARKALSKRARRYKREHGCKHHEALEAIARQFDFDNWKQIADGLTQWEQKREIFQTGCVIAYDGAELDDTDLSEAGFLYDDALAIHCDESLFKHLRNSVDEQDPQGRTFAETESVEESREYHEGDMLDLRFFYFDSTDAAIPANTEEVHDRLKGQAFWRPMHIWLRGTHYPVPLDNGAGDYHGASVIFDSRDWNLDDDFVEDVLGQDFDR